MNGTAPLLAVRGVVKSFPGVRALRGVDLDLRSGEVLALLGENGAGKSTLNKILGGAFGADSGTISVESRERQFQSPLDSRAAGIAVIYQEFNLVPALTAVENIFLGQEHSVAGFMGLGRERRLAADLFKRLGIAIDLDLPCRRLTTAQQQLVEVAKALALDARIIVMDEPTSSLSSHEVERLFEIIADLKSQGIGVIYVSHRLDEIFRIADRVTVLRDGATVGTHAIGNLTRDRLIEMMVGRTMQDEFPPRSVVIGPPRLEVKNLHRGRAVKGVSFHVGRGEIVALTGLIGAGRSETVRLIFGADRRDAGEIRLDGRTLSIQSPRDAIAAGIGLLTEDRKLQGLVLDHSVRFNFALPNLRRLSRFGFVQRRREREEFADSVASLRIKISGPHQLARNLSGGNQQKIVLAKWLARHCDVLIFDEPTRGIDVGTKFEIYKLMNDLAAQGKAIVMICSELPEALGMADRILVMHDGRIAGEIAEPRAATQEQIMRLAIAAG